MLHSLIASILKGRAATFIFFTVIGFILYGQTLQYGYTDLDDSILIQENSNFLNKLSNAGTAFTQSVFSMRPEDHDNYYRPILTCSFILDTQIGGTSLKIFHTSNIIIHIISSFLLFVFLLRLKYKKEISFCISLLFLSHPAFTTAVAWIPGRNDSLLAIFVLGAFIKQIDFYKKPTTANLLFHHLFFLLSLFTKETAIILPALFLAFSFLLTKDAFIKIDTKEKSSKKSGLVIGWIISIIIYEFMRHKVLVNAKAIDIKEMIAVFEQYAPTIIQYIGKLLFPFNLSTYPIMEDTTYLWGFLALAVIFIFLFIQRIKNTRYYWLGFIWFILFLLPVGIIKENALEHRIYISAIGFSLICLESEQISKVRFDNGIAKWIIVLIFLLFSFLTFTNCKNYKNEASFWKKGMETSPHSAHVHLQIGSYDQINGKTDDAEKEYRTAINLDPKQPNVNNNLGKICIAKGKLDEADLFLNQELKINPTNEVAYYNLSTVQEDRGDFTQAKVLLHKALELKPNYSDALVDLGILYAREQKFDDAIELFNKTLKCDPKNKLAYKNLTLVYIAKKQFDEAKKYYIISKQMGIDINFPALDSLKTY